MGNAYIDIYIYRIIYTCIIKQPLNFGRFGFLPVSENNGNSARFGPFLPDPNFSAISYFHTWSLLPHHIKSSNLQQFLPVKVQTLLCCYIKSRWWHERDNREHLPMWSSSCQHPQPQSLGHDKENHLKNWKALLYPLLKRRTGPHEEESDPLSVLKSIPRMATAMQPAINPLGVSAGG